MTDSVAGADGDLMSDDDRYMLMELLRAMLPKFEI